MEYFINTFAVVVGILAPFVIVAALVFVASVVKEQLETRNYKLAAKAAEAKMAAPYDDVQVSQPPNIKMFTLRLIKNNEVVWEKSYNKEMIKD